MTSVPVQILSSLLLLFFKKNVIGVDVKSEARFLLNRAFRGFLLRFRWQLKASESHFVVWFGFL